MNILTVYIPKDSQEKFEEFLLFYCEKINGAFYLTDFYLYIEQNLFIELEIDDCEVQRIKSEIGEFITYSIVWENSKYLFEFLKISSRSFVFCLDNDYGSIYRNNFFNQMTLDGFLDWINGCM